MKPLTEIFAAAGHSQGPGTDSESLHPRQGEGDEYMESLGSERSAPMPLTS